ncbi:heterokaryon incompatibility protein-domain-containing protein [Phaeosphaeriaceae sp. PMI808]|nr:heterokaryon incompatibility protein-domain-containing protein [Phaeosphaeriaceae sp. PMI808]
MFCSNCQVFWREAISHSQLPDIVPTTEEIFLKPYKADEFRDISQLHEFVNCSLCRAAYAVLSWAQNPSRFGPVHESLEFAFMLQYNRFLDPDLMIEFRTSSGEFVEIPPLNLAISEGIIYGDDQLVAALTYSDGTSNDKTGSPKALALAAFWLKRCIETHEPCRFIPRNEEAHFLPTRLLDVGNGSVRLIETGNEVSIGEKCQYVALSHCWGQVQIIRTTKDNYETHKAGIGPEQLSRTFQDAIQTVRSLGFRHIWIDSLCIIQDDEDDWLAEGATMCDIYRSATMTIMAAHASGGDVGCFKDRSGWLPEYYVIDLPCQTEGGKSVQAAFRPSPFFDVHSEPNPQSPLYGRAWVLQEQCLSARKLIFNNECLQWECICMRGSEYRIMTDMPRGDHKSIRTSIMNNWDYFNDPPFNRRWNSSIQTREDIVENQQGLWYRTVSDYTHLGMTKSKDRLIALAGISEALAQRTSETYLAGLWSGSFCIGLLWKIPFAFAQQHQSSRAYFDINYNSIRHDQNENTRHGQEVAPSWSWASVTVPITYDSTCATGSICEILDVKVYGSKATQFGRATIRGHTRRGYVNPVYPVAFLKTISATENAPWASGQAKEPIFNPTNWFQFSEKQPRVKQGDDDFSFEDGGLVRGVYHPDELIDPSIQITFLAIAQKTVPVWVNKHNESVRTIALVPSGKDNTYRRVGYAVWNDCAWYGYVCPSENIEIHDLERSVSPESDQPYGNQWHDPAKAPDESDGLEAYYQVRGGGLHAHESKAGCLPDLDRYHSNVDVQEAIVEIE